MKCPKCGNVLVKISDSNEIYTTEIWYCNVCKNMYTRKCVHGKERKEYKKQYKFKKVIEK